MVLDENKKSVYLIKYKMLLVVDSNSKIITESISDGMKSIFENTMKKYGITLEEWRFQSNHIEVTFKGVPSEEIKLSNLVNMFKSASSRYVRKNYPEVKENIEGEGFWRAGYCIISIGDPTINLYDEFMKRKS